MSKMLVHVLIKTAITFEILKSPVQGFLHILADKGLQFAAV